MIDVLKGIVRHDHGAMNLYFVEEKPLTLMHQERHLRVQDIISKDLLAGNYLWPGTPSTFWSKVAEGGSKDYE
jgi:hypothetical protein